jgi:hypothetical protein
MKKETEKTVITLMTFTISLIVLFSSISLCKLFQNTPESTQEGPHAIRQGRQITLKSPVLTFEIPQEWVNSYEAGLNNLHLSATELQITETSDKVVKAHYIRLINEILPFQRCAVQAGNSEWEEKHGFSLITLDLQMRVYVLDEAPEQVEGLIHDKGVIAMKARLVEQARDGTWHKTVLATPYGLDDYRGYVDFRFHRFEEQTIVVVFMYLHPTITGSSVKGEKAEAIEAILASFRS